MHNNQDLKFAGFWVRILAFIIDALVCSIPIMGVEKLLGEDSGITIVVTFVLLWLYSAIMLSSSWQATFGKKVLGLKVLSTEYEPLDFKKASIRFLYSLITYTLLFSPVIVIYLANGSFILWLVGIILILLPILMMFFNEKKQVLHDYLAHTIVLDMTQDPSQSPVKSGTILIRGIGITAIVLIVLFVGYYLIKYGTFIAVMGGYALSQERSYNASFHSTYPVNDFNDSRIIFYNKELEEHSKEFVEAEGMYDIFEADVKNDLSSSCVEYFLREHNDTEWIETGSRFRKNARNKYADSDKKVKNTKKNESHMGHHFYDYDLNEVNDIIDNIAYKWGDKNSNKETCQKLLPTDDMYEMFIVKYIYNREEALKRDKKELKRAPESGTLAKPFYRRSIQKTESWLRLLYKNNPDYNGDLYRFNRQISTSDISHILDKSFVVADRKRGIELWKEDNNTIRYDKTLNDNYKAYRVKSVEDKIFAFVKDNKSYRDRVSYLIAYKFDQVHESMVETDRWAFDGKLDLVDWDFLDNYTKVAMVFGYDGMRTFDISNPNKITEILKRLEKWTNYSRDIAIYGDNIYELARRGTYFYDHTKKIRLKKEISNSKKDPKIMALAINDNKNTMYKLGAFFKTKSYMLYKYNIDGINLSLLDAKKIDIDLTDSGVLGSRFPENMKVYRNHLFIAGKDRVYMFNEEMTMVETFEAESLFDFKLHDDKIIIFNYKGIINTIMDTKINQELKQSN